MVNSIIARIKRNILLENNYSNKNYIEYLKSLEEKEKQMLVISINSTDNYSLENIAEIISKKYDSLSNYHYAVLIFEDDNITWDFISEVAIFMENMHVEYGFNLFNKNKEKKVNELSLFIQNNKNLQKNNELNEEITNFYSGVAFGFQFEDLFISNNGVKKILIMQKIKLDERNKKCPSCFNEKVRGNSYSKMLYKSFECQNENCPSRSKIGRGKRFDLFSVKRQVMLDRHDECDYISEDVYNSFRKDIFEINKFDIRKIIDLYSWKGDTIEIVNSKHIEKSEFYRGRKIIYSEFKTFSNDNLFNNLPIVKLMKSINRNIDIDKKDFSNISYKKIKESLIVNTDSTQGIQSLNKIIDCIIGGVITSPPYFNAREYSQWSNFICYLIDMMINAKSVYLSLHENGKYIYNVGDIVGQDNIYITSNMSKRRLMLGFYSLFIFKIVGYKCLGNIIWDKGEVQSKRNSNSNHFPAYLKPVNVYEHCLLFSKNTQESNIPTEVKRIDPVKKINSKGENILGHTAPYPKEISKLIIPHIKKEHYVLDPFLGSGTTIMAMEEEGIKSIGFEIDENYYNLCLKRIEE